VLAQPESRELLELSIALAFSRRRVSELAFQRAPHGWEGKETRSRRKASCLPRSIKAVESTLVGGAVYSI
jgi:hypothetical protein